MRKINVAGTVLLVILLSVVTVSAAASDPSPANGAINLPVDPVLSWTAGTGVYYYKIYFGTNPTPGSSEYKNNQTDTSYNPGILDYNTTYYWRIDSLTDSGNVTGTIWSFTTTLEPDAASDPSPANGAVDVPIDTVLSWTASAGIEHHEVYFGTDPTPAYVGNTTAPTYNPGLLDYDTTYYWQIDEVYASGTITGTIWSFTTTLAPDAASDLSPANGAVDVPIDAVLSWTSDIGIDHHEVYFGTDPTPAYAGNTTEPTYDPGVLLDYNTTYYWQIDEVYNSGTVTGTIWSFTTALGPEAASDPSPVDGALHVLATAILNWTSPAGTLHHEVYFGTNSTPDYVGNTTETSYDPGLLDYDTTYYWRIDEVYTSGTVTGTVWSFTTTAVSAVAYWTLDDNAANTTVLDSGDNSYHGTFNDLTNPNTSYHHIGNSPKGTGALSFDGVNDYIQVYGYKGIDKTYSRSCTAWVKTTASQQGTIICWGTSTSRMKWIFRVEPGGALGVGVYGGTIQTTEKPLGDNEWHHVAVAFDEDETPNIDDAKLYIDGIQQSTTVTYADIMTGNIQDVMIGAHREDIGGGGTPNMYFKGQLDDVRIYDYALSAAEILQMSRWDRLPENGAIDVSLNAVLSWTAVEQVDSYDVYFGTDSAPGYIGSTTEITYDPGLLEYDTTYYWQIDEVYTSGTVTGTIWSFTTTTGAASEPSPADGAIDVPLDTILSWTAGEGALSHDVYFGTNSTPAYIGNFTEPTYDPGLLDYGTTYYWQIDELTASGTKTGTIWSFATVTGTAKDPSPADVTVDVLFDTVLSWTPGEGALSHDIYFGTDPTPDYIGNTTEPTYDPGLLAYNTTYHWRIDEVTALGTITGTAWSFTTVPAEILHAHWEMDEYKWDSTIYEIAGFGYNGQFNDASGVSYAFHHFRADCRQGFGSLWFDGIDDSITVSSYKGIVGTTSRTCAAWIKTSATVAQDIIGYGDSATAGGQWLLTITPSGTVQVAVSGGSQTGTTVVNNGRWHHIAAVLTSGDSPTVNDIQIYIDGIEENNYTTVSCAVDTVYDAGVQIGHYDDDGGSRYFEGLMDDVRIYGYDLSAQEIGALNPAFIWSMDDNTASTDVLDSGLNSKHGTLIDSTNPNTSAHHSSDCREGTGSLSFDGVDDSIQISGYQGVSGPYARTCSAWIKSSAATSQTIMAWGSSTGLWQFGITSSGTLEVKAGSGRRTGVTAVNDGQWHYVAAVMTNDVIHAAPEAWDNNNPKNDTFMIKLYIDGTEEPDYTTVDAVVNTYSSDIQIGSYNATDCFNGLMDDVRICGYALSDQDIAGRFAWDPTPYDGLLSEPSILSWESGDGAVSHDVYFGTDYNAVKNASRLAGDVNGDGPADIHDLLLLAAQWLTHPGIIDDSADVDGSGKVDIADFAALAASWGQTSDAVFKGNQLDTAYDPGSLDNETTYYWRVDEVDPSRPGSPLKGRVWSFTYMHMLTPEEFAILPWDHPGGSQRPGYDRVTLNTIRNCGFNLAGFVEPDKFDIVHKSRLKAFAIDWNTAPTSGYMMDYWTREQIDANVSKMVYHIGSHPATFGYFLVDEPGVGFFQGLGRWVDSFYQADPNPDHLSYINLLPKFVSTSIDYYESYIDYYIQTSQNRFISYDQYAVKQDGDLLYVDTTYFQSLAIVSAAAKNAGIPFWRIALSTPHWDYAPPTPGIFRFQLYTTLVYGARGISYFRYFSDDSMPDGPIDINGGKTATWYNLRDIILEMHRIGPVYLSLNHVNTFYYPWVYSPSIMNGIATSNYVQSLNIMGDNSRDRLCVGEFTDPSGTPFVLLSNSNYLSPIEFSITFRTTPSEIWYVNPATGQLELLEGSTITLDAGQGLFLKLVN